MKAADMVDHRVPLRAGGTHAEENRESMCWSCHAKKTARDRELYPDLYRANRSAH